MPDRDLLENAALYEWRPVALTPNLASLPRPGINLECPRCKDTRTFVMTGDWRPHPSITLGVVTQGTRFEPGGAVLDARYECAAACGSEVRFLVEFGAAEMHIPRGAGATDYRREILKVRKVGQSPPKPVRAPRAVKEWLADSGSLFEAGLQCVTRGQGIGACAYFRRVVEDSIARLMAEIPGVLGDAEFEAVKEQLARIEASRRTADKIDIVKVLLPSAIAGPSPIDVLHDLLSEGLHARSEAECLEIARRSQVVLETVIDSLVTRRDSIAKLGQDVGHLQKLRAAVLKKLEGHERPKEPRPTS